MPIRALPPRIAGTEPVPAKAPPIACRARLGRLWPTVKDTGWLRVLGIAGYSVGVVAVTMAITAAANGPDHHQADTAARASLVIARPMSAATHAPLTTTAPPSSAPAPSPSPTPLPKPASPPPPAPRPAPSRPDISNAEARKVVDWAQAQLGVPYVWGGASRSGYDCSGLVMRAWETVGVDLPHKASLQARAGVHITRAELMPGDLVISNGYGHVALYIGNGKVIQAPHTGTDVSIAPLPTRGVDAYVRVNRS